MVTRRQRQLLVAVSNPLGDPGILQQVFSCLPGCWLFIGAVCKEWGIVYATMGQHRVQCVSVNRASCHWQTYRAKTTLCSAAMAAPKTIRMAFECGLSLQADDEDLQLIAGLHASVETLKAVQEMGMQLSDIVVKAAARSGRLDILQHLLLEGLCAPPAGLSLWAAHSGSISMLKWLKAQSWCNFNFQTCAGAALGGQLAALQHLRIEGCDWSEGVIACHAATSGSIELVEWLRQQPGIQINAEVLAWAAGAGQTAMCAHLRSAGCDWDTAACTQALEAGHYDMLRWLREQGCPWSVSEICTCAASDGDVDILEYVIEQGEVLNAELLTKALNAAGAHDELQAAQWLRQRGAHWPALQQYEVSVYLPAQEWCGDTLAWARAEGCNSPTTM
jgi:hypothetical protein